MLDRIIPNSDEQFGHAPRKPGEEPPTSPVFREAMSRIAGAVHIVTTGGAAGRAGFTATSFTAVSDAPPTVLVCLNGTSRILPILEANGVFCVNTLASGDEDIADVFAGRTGLHGEDRFSVGQWRLLDTGSPALGSALASLDCRLVEARSIATHRVFIGEVLAIRIGGGSPALLYKDRGYRRL
ncbi:flavin reductase [Chelatococcus sp. SYSU_G07232]|uniref:Flavin reductase n=1 Tax=Chelatococcus albus TaxID=3047466 RepID=A0ABT7AGB4_9HYPH|nr:flavin reductase [Chelatococcus sp. SYSU_G07232]MDJ1158404.1 flavin reductase [Chelatococcus sp. SYSU_G07232]